MAQYSPIYEPRMSADASSFGLGGVLTQKQSKNGRWKPVVYISRGLSEAEKDYAKIEKQALAAKWACEYLSYSLFG